MKKTVKPIVSIYMSSIVEAKMLAAFLYRNGDGVFCEVPASALWEARHQPIEVALPHKKYMIYRGGDN